MGCLRRQGAGAAVRRRPAADQGGAGEIAIRSCQHTCLEIDGWLERTGRLSGRGRLVTRVPGRAGADPGLQGYREAMGFVD